MKPSDLALVSNAALFFEDPTVLTRILSYTGRWTEDGLKRLPAKWHDAINKGTTLAIEKCLWIAAQSLDTSEIPQQENTQAFLKSQKLAHIHTAINAVTGAVSGFLGPEMLLVELPISTSIMMRSIAATAKEFGFNLNDPTVLIECLYVFAIGGPNPDDDGLNSSYLTHRLAFASTLRAATEAIVGLPTRNLLSAIENQSAPALIRLIAFVADSFGVRVTEKVIAQLAPVLGAVGGAGINVAFSDYFSKAARHHFALKKLELEFGNAKVSEIYELNAKKIRASKKEKTPSKKLN